VTDDRRTILVVDHEVAIRSLLRDFLIAHGYDVIEASDANHALAKICARDDIDLVVTDIVMPGSMSGFDLGRWVSVNRPAVKVLFMSGHDEAKMIPDSAKRDLIPKPFRNAVMLRRVEEALDHPRLRISDAP
jgi:DNA-binding NtrC family response regulator